MQLRSPSNYRRCSLVIAVLGACLALGAKTLTISPDTLPDGTVGQSYSQALNAGGCSGPCVWSASGTLPPGLSLGAASGAITGTPTSPGTFAFSVTATDQKSQTGSRDYSVNISGSLTITTSSPLAAGTVRTPYSQTLSASGGTPPYTWSLAAGSLAAGVSLNLSSGAISGTPTTAGTFSFTIQVVDKNRLTSNKSFTLSVAASTPPNPSPTPTPTPTPPTQPATPTLSISGVPNTTGSGIQMPFNLVLSSAAAQPISGQVVMTFQPDAAVSRDDPSIQFSTGGRTVSFTIPAGATKALFPASALAFQTGSVAGTLTFIVDSSLSGGNLSQNVVVSRAGPFILSATVVPNNSGFQLQVSGFSNSRELAGASFHFTAASGQLLQTSDLTLSLTNSASQWFTSSASTAFGGQFLLVVPFAVTQGAASGLSSVAVQIQNGQGTSATATARF